MTKVLRFALALSVTSALILSSLGTASAQSSTVVGATADEFGVGRPGAESYSIPISVTPGIKPKLTLQRNSSADNGAAGIGWMQSGLSIITRRGEDLSNDNEYPRHGHNPDDDVTSLHGDGTMRWRQLDVTSRIAAHQYGVVQTVESTCDSGAHSNV